MTGVFGMLSLLAVAITLMYPVGGLGLVVSNPTADRGFDISVLVAGLLGFVSVTICLVPAFWRPRTKVDP
jgi:hypothetical protein